MWKLVLRPTIHFLGIFVSNTLQCWRAYKLVLGYPHPAEQQVHRLRATWLLQHNIQHLATGPARSAILREVTQYKQYKQYKQYRQYRQYKRYKQYKSKIDMFEAENKSFSAWNTFFSLIFILNFYWAFLTTKSLSVKQYPCIFILLS